MKFNLLNLILVIGIIIAGSAIAKFFPNYSETIHFVTGLICGYIKLVE